MTSTTLIDRFDAAARRRAILLVLLAVILVGCAGADRLLHLATTVDMYFHSGDFGYNEPHISNFVGRVLGSGWAW